MATVTFAQYWATQGPSNWDRVPYGEDVKAAIQAGINAVTPAAAPTITGISPNTGPAAGGTAITITGTSFLGAIGVTVGGVAATNVVVVSATSITCKTPAHAAGAVNVVVSTARGDVTSTGGYTYS